MKKHFTLPQLKRLPSGGDKDAGRAAGRDTGGSEAEKPFPYN